MDEQWIEDVSGEDLLRRVSPPLLLRRPRHRRRLLVIRVRPNGGKDDDGGGAVAAVVSAAAGANNAGTAFVAPDLYREAAPCREWTCFSRVDWMGCWALWTNRGRKTSSFAFDPLYEEEDSVLSAGNSSDQVRRAQWPTPEYWQYRMVVVQD